MRICDLHTPTGMLRKAVASLKETWQAVSGDWRDEVRMAFARDRLDPLLPEVQLLLVELERFAEVLHDAEQVCTDRDLLDESSGLP